MEEILKYFPEIGTHARSCFERLYPLYKEWNEKINVISRKDMDNFYLHHVLHSLAIARHRRFEEGATVLDVGTGGGFPGIPLAIYCPQCRFTLVDSIGKKIKVVQEVVNALSLTNVTALQIRAEQFDGRFDYIVSRAVTELSGFYPWIKGKYNKSVLYLKGGEIGTEIETAARKCKIKRELIEVTDISRFFSEEYFAGKRIVEIKRNF